jgi:hypothetical protein
MQENSTHGEYCTKADIGTIVTLLKSRDFAAAEALCRQGLVAEPDDPELKMCLGISRHLQGDRETFRKIHAELAPRMAKLARTGQVRKDVLAMWKKYNGIMMEYVVLGALVLGVGVATACVFGENLRDQFRHICSALDTKTLYAGPEYYERNRRPDTTLYAGPEYFHPDIEGKIHGNSGD